MKVGVFQFCAGSGVSANFEAIERAIRAASEGGVRMLVFQECAACGYPPIETPDAARIDHDAMDAGIESVRRLAKRHDMYIALGRIRREANLSFNSLQLIDPRGETLGYYDKRARWGWDLDNFEKGESPGIFEIDGIRIGLRICYEIRFPEYFRELFRADVELCFVSFCDVAESDVRERRDIISAHLRTRAAENIMTVVSVNSISQHQAAPTAVFDVNGCVVAEAPADVEYLLIYDHRAPALDFSARGRMHNALELTGMLPVE